MKKVTFIWLWSLAIVLIGCRQGDRGYDLEILGHVEFSFVPEELSPDLMLEPAFLRFNVEEEEGAFVKETVPVHSLNGVYFTLPLKLPVGNYRLREFVVLNDKEDEIYNIASGSEDTDEMLPENDLSFSVKSGKLAELLLHVKHDESTALEHFAHMGS